MIFERTEQNPGARLLFILALLVVVVHGLRLAAPILLPAAMALFLAVLSLPVMLWLVNRRVPSGIATLLTVLLIVAVVGLLILLATSSVSELQDNLQGYAQALSERQTQAFGWIERTTGFDPSEYVAANIINASAIIDFVRGALGQIAQFVSVTFLVFLITAFMLGEATVFPDKFRQVLGPDAQADDRLQKVVREVQTYLGIKTMVSLATGLILGLWAYAMGLDFPVLLGLIAFVLNYVPTVGSIIAAVPAVLLSLILYGTLGHAVVVSVGYVTVNTLFGNILEPNLMGRRLGLSTLVVILSLLFWGWAWGPMGALLSEPGRIGEEPKSPGRFQPTRSLRPASA